MKNKSQYKKKPQYIPVYQIGNKKYIDDGSEKLQKMVEKAMKERKFVKWSLYEK